jgi:hypothetical protein
MIRDRRAYREFEIALLKKEKADYRKNRRIFNAMVKEAMALKAFPRRDPLEGMETIIKLARALNSV